VLAAWAKRWYRLSMKALLGLILTAATTLSVGQKAPDFKLDSTSGKPVTLASLLEKGPVILAFFPKAFTGG
jgi:peroxiredoxin Q/BCP